MQTFKTLERIKYAKEMSVVVIWKIIPKTFNTHLIKRPRESNQIELTRFKIELNEEYTHILIEYFCNQFCVTDDVQQKLVDFPLFTIPLSGNS